MAQKIETVKPCDYSSLTKDYDENVDTDGDGIPDIRELRDMKKVLVYDSITTHNILLETWTFVSNPADSDTDGDGVVDGEDIRPNIYDTILLENTTEYIKFNTGHIWKKMDCTAEQFENHMAEFFGSMSFNTPPAEKCPQLRENFGSNINIDYSLEELVIISLLNTYGLQLYMSWSTYKNNNDSKTLFETLVNRKQKYYQHSGILIWSEWNEVPENTEGGFFKGAVRGEADFNVNTKYLSMANDVYALLDCLIKIGCVIIATIIVINVTPIIISNIQAIVFYVKTFGVVGGINMYLTFGTSMYPDGIISAIQYDMSDGDCDLYDVATVVTKDGKEVFYRTMPQEDYDYLCLTNRIKATSETCISPTAEYSSKYNGVLVRFEVNAGTTAQLEKIGLRNYAGLSNITYPDMPLVNGIKWTKYYAFFKAEGLQINIGLGKGVALDIFNQNIISYEQVFK